MDENLVHVRGRLPWLRSGPLFRVSTSALPLLQAMLSDESFDVRELDGRRMTGRLSAHSQLAEAFDFPDYYGNNWDAFNDCMGDFMNLHDGHRIAVIWNHIAAAASAAPVTTAEVGWALLDMTFRLQQTPSTQLAIFAIGDGDEFDRPDER